MKICVYGAGAIGGLIGARLAQHAPESGADVTLIARGPHLEAILQRGLILESGGTEITVRPAATDNPAEAGPQDFVIVAVKAQAQTAIARAMQPLLGPKTAVVLAINGVPWWYFHGSGGPYEGRQLESLDPGGQLWREIGPERVIGCVVYPAAEVIRPGVVHHHDGDRFSLGEPDGSRSERVRALSALLIQAGFKAPVKTDIRAEIWVKLWGNVAFNPVSALTGATMAAIIRDPDLNKLVRAMMTEAAGVAEALGIAMPISLDQRLQGAAGVGEHKTSMLQDLERGRPMEIDAIVGAVAELGRLTGTPTPAVDAVLALIRMRARLAGLYG